MLARDDPFEGSATIASRRFAARLRQDEDFADDYVGKMFSSLSEEQKRVVKTMLQMEHGDAAGFISNYCFVSCWHSSEHESAALWKLYSGVTDGVAVQSTVGRLSSSIDTPRELILGAVEYKDYETEHAKSGQMLSPAFTKRKSFEHERELRLLFWDVEEWQRAGGDQAPWERSISSDVVHTYVSQKPGTLVRCDTAVLFENILVSPYADPWVVETVQTVLGRLRSAPPVKRSTLMDQPGG